MKDTVLISATDCYWVKLPANSRTWTRDRILSGIEEFVPCEPDNLDLCWALGTDGQVIALAVDPVFLDNIILQQPAVWQVLPDVIPTHVQIPGVTPEDLNLIRDRREQPTVRLSRRILSWGAPLVTVIVIAFIFIGAVRRHNALYNQRSEALDTLDACVTAYIPAALGGTDPDPNERLSQAHRMVSQLNLAAEGDNGAAIAFVTILAAWQPTLQIETSNFSIDSTRFTISGTAKSVEDAQALATALTNAMMQQPGWRMLPLQASSTGGTLAFSCSAIREGLQ